MVFFLLSKNKFVSISKNQTKNNSQWGNLFFSVACVEKSPGSKKNIQWYFVRVEPQWTVYRFFLKKMPHGIAID